MNDNQLLKERVRIFSIKKFVILSMVSLGLFELWWIYKSWKFFNKKENLDIYPFFRALFSIIFLSSLFDKIQDYSQSQKEYQYFNSFGFYFAFIVFNLLARLDDPYWIISVFSFIFLIPALKSFNGALKKDKNYEIEENDKFSIMEGVLITIGVIIWILILLEMFF